MLDRTDHDDSAIDLTDIIARLWQRRLRILITAVVAIVVALVVVRLIGPAYTVELKITPASASDNLSGKIGQFSGLAAAAGISLDKSSAASPFDLYLEMLRSRELAQALSTDQTLMHGVFDREWDASRGTWHKPSSLTSTLAGWARALTGTPPHPWRAPDAARLQRYLGEHIVVAKGTKDPVTRIIYEHRDPAFGQYVLARMNAVTDAIVRKQTLDRAAAYVRYLTAKLPTILVVEQRQALTSILSDQEKSIMMASTPLPFAAIPIDTINASEHPTKPNGFLIVGVGIVLGLVLGLVVALADWSGLARAVRSRSNVRA